MLVLEDLQIDNLKIYQDNNLYNFTTDAVLLANFVNFNAKSVVVDLCSGNGVVGILASSKNNYKKIYLVEIQECLASLCKKSVEYNNLKNFEVINDELKSYNLRLLERPMVIVCNKMDDPGSELLLEYFKEQIGDKYKILVPIEFGGGYIEDYYYD